MARRKSPPKAAPPDKSGRYLTTTDIAALARWGDPTEVFDHNRAHLRLRVTGPDRAYWRWGGMQRQGKRVPAKTIGPAYKRGWLKGQIEAAQHAAWATADKWHMQYLNEGVTPAEVVAAERKARARELDSRPPTLRDYIKDTYAPFARKRNKRAEESLARIEKNFYAFEVPKAARGANPARLGDWPITEISQEVITAWQDARLDDGIANATIVRDVGALRAALSPGKVPALAKWLAAPTFRNAGLKVVNEHPRYLRRGSAGEDDEAERFLAAIDAREDRIRSERRSANEFRAVRGYAPYPDLDGLAFVDHVKPFLLILLHTGMRPGELRALTWGAVDLPNRRLTVRAVDNKTASTRTIPMNKTVLDALTAWREQTTKVVELKKGANGRLVFAQEDGTPVGSLRTVFDNLKKAARLDAPPGDPDHFRLYDLRHTFASWLCQAGADLYRIADLMGHKSVTMTERYAHLQPDHGHELVEMLVTKNEGAA